MSETIEVAIVGSGLSGLVCANRILNLLAPNVKVVIFERDERSGGRIYSQGGIDLGACWTWTGHDLELLHIARNCGVDLEHQYVAGTALLQLSKAVATCYGDNISPSGQGSVRFKPTAYSIINSLVDIAESQGASIRLGTSVNLVRLLSDGQIQVNFQSTKIVGDGESDPTQNSKNFDLVIIAAPPRAIMNGIKFHPPLPSDQIEAMQNTPTWMQNTGKVAFIYDAPFWRTTPTSSAIAATATRQSRQYDGNIPNSNSNNTNMNIKTLSGTVFSECGPLRQIWDNSSPDTGVYALVGFVFDGDLQYLSDEATLLFSPLLQQLVDLFGEKASTPSRIVYKSWQHIDDDILSTNTTSSPSHSSRSTSRPCAYGNEYARMPHFGGRLIFSGTETARGESGHMNGAVVAGIRAADEAFIMLKKREEKNK
jgi:monoamine oxidase